MVMPDRAEEGIPIVRDNDNKRAFDEIYNAYFSRVYNYVHYRVDDFYDAEDVTGQIFEKLLKGLKYYRPEKAPFSAWLFSIARNAITDYYRVRMRTQDVSIETATDLINSAPEPDDIVAFNQTQQCLHKALSYLTQRERDIIALKFWSGLSNRDIAKFVGISESNAGVILFRAMRRLRRILENQGMRINDGKN